MFDQVAARINKTYGRRDGSMKVINKKLIVALSLVAAGAAVVNVAKKLDQKLIELPKSDPQDKKDKNGHVLTGKVRYEDDAYRVYDVAYYMAIYHKMTGRTYYLQCNSNGPQTYVLSDRENEFTISNGFALERVEEAMTEGRKIVRDHEEYTPREWCDQIVRMAEEHGL